MMYVNGVSGVSGQRAARSSRPASKSQPRSSASARHTAEQAQEPREAERCRGPLLLVMDLESITGTRGGEVIELAERLSRRPETSVLYAAPDRSLTSANACIDALEMPAADVLVADQGASVSALHHDPRLEDLDAELGERWPGTYEVRTRMTDLGHLLGEHRWEGARRMSYFPLRDVALEEARLAVEEALTDLDVDVLVDEQDRIDVLPKGTDTATTVMRTLDALKTDPGCVVVSGGFLEPRIFDRRGYWGIATGDTPRLVRASLVHNLRIHLTSAEGAAGVLDGLHALAFL